MRALSLIGLLVAANCGAAPPPAHAPEQSEQSSDQGIRAARGPFTASLPPPTADAPEVWLTADRDVILLGQLPSVDVHARRVGGGQYHAVHDFSVLPPVGAPASASCDEARRPTRSRGFAALNFECHPISAAGIHLIHVEPSRFGLRGQPVTLPIRVLTEPLRPRPAPAGWRAVSLTAEPSARPCTSYGPHYVVATDGASLVIKNADGHTRKLVDLPVDLAPRLSAAHAKGIAHVFETDDGWIVLSDHGEFGGGIEWFARTGGNPRPIVIGNQRADDDFVPQNVNRAMIVDGALYVLQGLSHLGLSRGQLSKVWREHNHFTTHVVARFASEPYDWIVEPEGTWLIATSDAIWRTSSAGLVSLVARLPERAWEANSLARSPDGTLYVGMRGTVLRLTPTWAEAPRYATDTLLPPTARAEDCPATGR